MTSSLDHSLIYLLNTISIIAVAGTIYLLISMAMHNGKVE